MVVLVAHLLIILDQMVAIIHQLLTIKTCILGTRTWHVFNRRAEIGKGISTYWWNANNWDNASAADGYTIDYRPTVGSIAQTDAGYYGHVAFVERE